MTKRGIQRWLAGTGIAVLCAIAAARARAEPPPFEDRAGGSSEARVELGRRLFFDPALSVSATRSCATCHDPDHGFSSTSAHVRDELGFTSRHVQTLVDFDDRVLLHSDGELEDLEDLVRARLHGWSWGRIFGPLRPVGPAELGADYKWASLERGLEQPEMLKGAVGLRLALESEGLGVVHAVDVESRISELRRYRTAFEAAFGTPSTTTERLASALSAYLRTLRTGESALDRFLHGEEAALSPSERRGFELFRGKARCSQCHLLGSGDRRPPLTDGKFHDTGIATRSGTSEEDGYARTGLQIFHKSGYQPARGQYDIASNDPGNSPSVYLQREEVASDRGRGERTNASGYERAFRTPTLRDVAARGPFMHDGSLATLADVVEHYADGAGKDPLRDPRVRGFEATAEERADLVAFLASLRGGERPGLAASAWTARVRETALRFVDAAGRPLPAMKVRVVPEGDPLPNSGGVLVPADLVTDADGRLKFRTTNRTHVRLVLPEELLPHGGALIPDTCPEAEVQLTVRGRGTLVVTFPADTPAPPNLTMRHLDGEIARQWPRQGNQVPFGGLLLDTKTTWERRSVVRVGGHDVARYEGWVRSFDDPTVLFVVPGGYDPTFASPVPDRTVEVDLRATAPRRAITPAGAGYGR